VQADNYLPVADELYGLLPAEFTAARDARARAARSAGQRDTAAAIGKLTRPTVSAWLVNQLVRAASAPMGRLFDVGEALHDAQRDLAGERLRELSGQRRQVIAELLADAARLAEQAGVSASGAAMDEVRATLEAAMVDAEAREEVRSGRLVKPLAYAGLGDIDLTAALAATAASGRPAGAAGPGRVPRAASRPGTAGAGGGKAGRATKADQARQDVLAAQAAASAAAQSAADAEAQVASLDEQRDAQRRQVEHRREELERAEREERSLARQGRQARAALESATRTLQRAERDLARARERAGDG
jgi:hypothetical protein